MSSERLQSLASAPGGAPTIMERRSASYHPSVWGDRFLNYTSETKVTDLRAEERLEKLKMEVKIILSDSGDSHKPLDKLYLIDQILRLGIGYHFGEEIDSSLEQIQNRYFETDHSLHDVGDLASAALLFRLFRQHGYRISCDVFTKFMDTTGKFKAALVEDVRGLLGLYEASHFRIHGEDILEEALNFTVHNLNCIVRDNGLKLNQNLITEIKHALEWCLHKGLVRLDARRYINLYEEDASHSAVLLEFAKLDFNILQKMHQKELGEITRWSKNCLDLKRNFPFARDRVTECYFWILGVYFERGFSLARMMLVKVISLISIMDDIYDAFGHFEQLQVFTDAISRWDMETIDELPQYMQIFYKALLDTYEDFENILNAQERGYRIFYSIEAMKNLANCYFKEAIWLHENYIPTLEEYMPLAMETSTHGKLVTSSFLGMGDVASEKAFIWLLTDPKILRGSKTICRLMDDIVTHKFEQQRGHVASAVECYMKQHNATEQDTCTILWKMIDDAWKEINEECLQPTPVPRPLLTRILNFTRVIEVLYRDKDRYTNSETELKGYVISLLVDPIQI